MTIKEIEEQLQIPRATVRFYEKQELISPKRHNNEYRDYSEEDVLRLKQIIMLRKMGFSIIEIRQLFSEGASLPEMAGHKISELQAQKQELDGAIALCSELTENHIEIKELNEQYWLKVIDQEKHGHKFMTDFINDAKLTMYRMASNIEYSGSTGPRTPSFLWNPLQEQQEQIGHFWARHRYIQIILMLIAAALCLIMVLMLSSAL